MTICTQGELFSNITYMDIASIQIQASQEERGAVYTKPEVVDFILDLAGYTTDRPLHEFRILEPSFGVGDFLLPIVERLLTAYLDSSHNCANIVEGLSAAVRAVEVHGESIKSTRIKLIDLLQVRGIAETDAHRLVDKWIIEGDFLLAELPHTFTHAVGNPPYVRQELIPEALMAEYRTRYSTIYDRADLYIPFIERCLRSLEPEGALGFICADRWMKNRYGGPLRAMIAKEYHLAVYVDMVDTPAFHSEVISYPAITIIRRESSGPTRIAFRPLIERKSLRELARAISANDVMNDRGVIEVADVTRNSEPWLLQTSDQLRVLRRLEADFPLLEEVGCKVGIGVATGADKIFIGQLESLRVEPDRKLPLVTTKDIETGTVQWKGFGVINPFGDDGQLVDLADYPMLSAYLEKHSELIRKRNIARKNPRNWFRTIDRIYPELVNKPKLLIPDIKGEAHIVYEEGRFYPHHNLYFVTSREWDLRALQAVLLSSVTKLFISTYSTQMRGGYLRFQAQYLRRIRLPKWQDVPDSLRDQLIDAAVSGDVSACNQAAYDLYMLTTEERHSLNDNRLVAAIEFKSQVGPSFGNNFNNRTEEAIGTSVDFWTASVLFSPRAAIKTGDYLELSEMTGGTGGSSGGGVIGVSGGGVGGNRGGASRATPYLTTRPGTPCFDGFARSVVSRVLLLEVREHVLGAVGGPERQGPVVLLVEPPGAVNLHRAHLVASIARGTGQNRAPAPLHK